MGVYEIEDLLLGKDVVRLPRQYDASNFLQMCSLNEQYRILASICRSESRNLPRRSGDDCSTHHDGRNGDAADAFEQHHDGVPDIYYSARLLAFTSGCGPEAGPLNILKKEHIRQQEQQKENAAAECAGVDEGEGNEAYNREIWYDEEGGYYYDSYGYYDADGSYYYFETAEAAYQEGAEAGQTEGEQHEETAAEAQEEAANVMPRDSQCDGEVEDEAGSHNIKSDGMEADLARYRRVVPDDGQLAPSPFLRGVCTLERAVQFMEQSITPVDVFLRENNVIPSFPVCDVANPEAAGGRSVDARPECIHLLASSQHLHIVYVPAPLLNGQEKQSEDEQGEKMDALAPLLDSTRPAGVLMSIPLHNLGENCTTCYGSLGNGRVLLEIYAATGKESGVTLSMIFGISPDALFRSAPLASRLVECYEQRVLHHLAKSGCVLDELLHEQLGDANIGVFYTSEVSRPLFSYSALLLREGPDTTHVDTDGGDMMHELVYHEASNSVFFAKEREATEQRERKLEEALYLARNMEPPHWRFLREALNKVQQDECEDRDKLMAEAWAPYETSHQPSFHTIACAVLPLLRMQEASVEKLMETEERQWEGLLQRFSERKQWLLTEETRRRLEEQFAFERRLQLLQCSVNLDILVERETAMRATAERDEVLERHSGELLECWITLLTCRRTEELCRTTPVKDGGIMSATRYAEETDEEMEGRLGRTASRSQESRQPQRASTHSIQSPTTEDFMRMVAVGHRGALAPCRTQPLRQFQLPTA